MVLHIKKIVVMANCMTQTRIEKKNVFLFLKMLVYAKVRLSKELSFDVVVTNTYIFFKNLVPIKIWNHLPSQEYAAYPTSEIKINSK